MTTAKYVAFFRNVNLGRPHCPTKAQLEEAFTASGSDWASSFLTNGTLVFGAASEAKAQKVLKSAVKALQAECGLKEPAFLRSVDVLAELVALGPFASVDPDSVYERCISFLSPERLPPPPLPLKSTRQDVEILRFTGSEALSVSLKIGRTPGSPNAFLEKLLGSPASTRNWNTIVRLVHKHA